MIEPIKTVPFCTQIEQIIELRNKLNEVVEHLNEKENEAD